jgi:hypothetical protein
MDRERAQDFDQELLDLYDDYAHGRLSRRDFGLRAAKFAVAGVTAEALLARLRRWSKITVPIGLTIPCGVLSCNSNPRGTCPS